MRLFYDGLMLAVLVATCLAALPFIVWWWQR